MLRDQDEIEDKISWLKENGYWNNVRKMYLRLKNNNTDEDKKSRSLRLEAINNVYNQYVGYDDEDYWYVPLGEIRAAFLKRKHEVLAYLLKFDALEKKLNH